MSPAATTSTDLNKNNDAKKKEVDNHSEADEPIGPPKEPIHAKQKHLTADGITSALQSDDAGSIHLGSDDAISKTEWAQAGAKHILLAKELGDLHFDGPEDDTPVRDAAILSVCGEVTNTAFYFTPRGAFFPGGKYARRDEGIESTKVSGLLVRPTIGNLGTLWSSYTANATVLQNSVPRVHANKRGFFETRDGVETIRMCHSLYEKTNGYVSQADRTRTAEWPVDTKLQKNLEDLVEARSHVISPLPLYGPDHKLIENPNLWEGKLRGAIVEVHFTLEHWRFPNSRESTFVPRIVELTILRLPLAVISPLKRRVTSSNYGPSMGSGSPAKKRRLPTS